MAKKDRGLEGSEGVRVVDEDDLSSGSAKAREAFVRLLSDGDAPQAAATVAAYFFDRLAAFFDDVAAIRRAIERPIGDVLSRTAVVSLGTVSASLGDAIIPLREDEKVS